MTAPEVTPAKSDAEASKATPLGRSYVYLWGASGSSNLADGILLAGAPLLAVTLTRSPILVSFVTALVWLPALLLSLHAGAAADRYDRRRIMVVASWTRVGLMAVVALVAALGGLNLSVLYATVLIAGTAEVFSDTSAQSVLPMIVHRDQLGKANGRLIAVQTVANNFLGAPIAGVLVGVAAASVFGAVGFCFAVAGFLLLRIKGGFRVSQGETRPMLSEIAAGLRYLWRHRLLRYLAIAAGLFNLGGNAFTAVFVLWVVGAESAVGMSAVEFGLVGGAIGVGAVAGSLLVEKIIPRLGAARTLLIGLAAMSGFLTIPVLVPTPVAIFAAVVPLGACLGAVNVVVVSMRQRMVPAELLGRVNASYRMIGLGGIPIGALLGGVVAELIALQAALFTGVGLCLVACALVARHVTTNAVAAAEKGGSGLVLLAR